MVFILVRLHGAQRVGYSETRRLLRRLRNAEEESGSLIVCGRVFQNLGAELERALEPLLLGAFFNSAWNP